MKRIDLEQEQLSDKDKKMTESYSEGQMHAGESGQVRTTEYEAVKFTDPRQLIKKFEKTKELKSFMRDRMKNMPAFNGRKRSEITDDEISEEIEFARETDGYKDLLMHYFQNYDQPLSYDPGLYSKEFIDEIEDYWKFIIYERRVKDKHGPEVKHENDLERSRLHMRAARQLTNDGIAPNDKIARLIVHFLSIDQGYDDLDFYRDENRRALTLQ